MLLRACCSLLLLQPPAWLLTAGADMKALVLLHGPNNAFSAIGTVCAATSGFIAWTLHIPELSAESAASAAIFCISGCHESSRTALAERYIAAECILLCGHQPCYDAVTKAAVYVCCCVQGEAAVV
jgi:hypothetical protein